MIVILLYFFVLLISSNAFIRSSFRSQIKRLSLKMKFDSLPDSVKPGVVTGQALTDLLDYAKDRGFAIPGVNIVGTNSINACMEAAAKVSFISKNICVCNFLMIRDNQVPLTLPNIMYYIINILFFILNYSMVGQ